MKLKNLFVITAAALAAAPAVADINIGVVASLTGPAAALGAETRKAVSLFPASVGGEKVNFILLDDATDPTAAVKNVRKLISEDKVDAILGPNLISTAVAMADVANGVNLYRWLNMDYGSVGYVRPELPNVRRWFERLSERPGYRQWVQVPIV